MVLIASSKQKSLVIGGAAILILLGGIFYFASKQAPTIPPNTNSDFVSVGDTLGAMTVVSVAPFNTGQYSTDPKMTQLGPQNAKIILKGPIEITGMYSTEQPGMGGSSGPCMSVSDAASLTRLPVIPMNGVRPEIQAYSFCFRNSEAAEQQLGKESRIVTVTIDNFELNAYPAEVMSWADLVKPDLAASLTSCKAFPNNSTQHVVETTRIFINTPKDIYLDKNISSDFKTVSGNATAGYVSNGGLPGEATEASPGCWSTYFEFDGIGEVDLKIKSAVEDVPDYFVRFVVGPTQ